MEEGHPIMVSICCITYNHEKYIAQAIEGFLMQRTSFRSEIIIGEDCSTDETRKLIDKYQQKHPETISIINSGQNVGSIGNQVRTMNQAKGRYIAMCDGDDFWTNPLKLQKQVDFLESNPDYIACCHYSQVIDDDDKIVYVHPAPIRMQFSYDDLLMGKREETRICSLMVRNCKDVRSIGQTKWYSKTYGSDALFKLYATRTGKKIYVIPEVMSCYRLHAGGIWSMIDSRLRKSRMLSDFNLTIAHFPYSSEQKKALLKLYVRQYLLFDIRQFKFNNAIKTIKTLW